MRRDPTEGFEPSELAGAGEPGDKFVGDTSIVRKLCDSKIYLSDAIGGIRKWFGGKLNPRGPDWLIDMSIRTPTGKTIRIRKEAYAKQEAYPVYYSQVGIMALLNDATRLAVSELIERAAREHWIRQRKGKQE